eukprot:jgi/Hompol1/4762/HPOL_003860-RA
MTELIYTPINSNLVFFKSHVVPGFAGKYPVNITSVLFNATNATWSPSLAYNSASAHSGPWTLLSLAMYTTVKTAVAASIKSVINPFLGRIEILSCKPLLTEPYLGQLQTALQTQLSDVFVSWMHASGLLDSMLKTQNPVLYDMPIQRLAILQTLVRLFDQSGLPSRDIPDPNIMATKRGLGDEADAAALDPAPMTNALTDVVIRTIDYRAWIVKGVIARNFFM